MARTLRSSDIDIQRGPFLDPKALQGSHNVMRQDTMHTRPVLLSVAIFGQSAGFHR